MLINECTGAVLARQVRVRRTPWERSVGLMFRRGIDPEEAMVFCLPRSGIREAGVHMLFVPFSIGLFWLDEGCQVVDKMLAQPWRMGYQPGTRARYFVEAHPSRFELVRIGDRLQWGEG